MQVTGGGATAQVTVVSRPRRGRTFQQTGQDLCRSERLGKTVSILLDGGRADETRGLCSAVRRNKGPAPAAHVRSANEAQRLCIA